MKPQSHQFRAPFGSDPSFGLRKEENKAQTSERAAGFCWVCFRGSWGAAKWDSTGSSGLGSSPMPSCPGILPSDMHIYIYASEAASRNEPLTPCYIVWFLGYSLVHTDSVAGEVGCMRCGQNIPESTVCFEGQGGNSLNSPAKTCHTASRRMFGSHGSGG